MMMDDGGVDGGGCGSKQRLSDWPLSRAELTHLELINKSKQNYSRETTFSVHTRDMVQYYNFY